MKSLLVITLIVLGLVMTAQSKNPFYQEWDTPFGAPPFSEIKEADYMPAFKEDLQDKEIWSLINYHKNPIR